MDSALMYNPNIPLFNGTLEETIAAGGFPLQMSTEAIFSIAHAFELVFGPAMIAFQDAMMLYAPVPTTYLKDWASNNMHPLSAGMPLTDPIDVMFCIVAYFVSLAFFFLVGRVTGKLQMRYFGILHNTFLAVLSLYMGVGFLWDLIALHGYSLWNNYLDTSHPIAIGVRNISWVFTVSKLPEYVDTYIMILKQNYRQVSFLHLYHHCSIYIVCYMFFVYCPGSDGVWAGMVNSLIHVVMYIYYLLNLIFRTGPVKEFVQRNKFIITRCQITQFVLNFVQTAFILFIASPIRCNVNQMWINFFYMMTMIALFTNFMIQNQRQIREAKAKKDKEKTKAKKEN
eukprot:GILI01010776.1.p1 GENE.GILI01010776.1~~GILI01010776.1.p1  ORF type:complete len:364 (-),score=61.83 GILI01010776.1:150-1169(-)